MTYTTAGGHDWAEEDGGGVDFFACESGYHNGPICRACNEGFCEHCEPECYKQLCPMVLTGSVDSAAIENGAPQ